MSNTEENKPALPQQDPSQPATSQGLFHKFLVKRLDGKDQPGAKHEGCDYFVIDVTHDEYAKEALRAYAAACEQKYPGLSAGMRERYGLDPLLGEQLPHVAGMPSALRLAVLMAPYHLQYCSGSDMQALLLFGRAVWRAALASVGKGCKDPKHMGKFACADSSQCWEPCGSLGKDPQHAKAVQPNGSRMSDHSFKCQWYFVVPPRNLSRIVISQRQDGPFRDKLVGGAGHYSVSMENYESGGYWVHVPGSTSGGYSSFERAFEHAERVWRRAQVEQKVKGDQPIDDTYAGDDLMGSSS